jgi:hypothetical protein
LFDLQQGKALFALGRLALQTSNSIFDFVMLSI